MIPSVFITAVLAIAPAPLSGLYRARQMEVAAAIELSRDGSFRYQLDYGAVSEAAEGSWTVGDGAVLLTSRRFVGAYKAREFHREPLTIRGTALELDRYDTVIRFIRAEPASDR